MKNKERALELLKQKNNGEIDMSYESIGTITNYSKRQLIRLSKLIEKKDIEDLIINGNKDKKSNNSACEKELNYIIKFKEQYPVISISQFMDIYHEDVIFNRIKVKEVVENSLKVRSKSFYQQLYKKQGWLSPIKHAYKKELSSHPLREASPKKGILIMLDGTPHDWFENGNKLSLHLALDDATGEIISGYFMPTERLLGYAYVLYFMIIKYGIPISVYSDKHTIFKSSKDGNLTQFGRMCDELGITSIFANTPQAKGKIERMNYTVQNRLIIDLKRHKIDNNNYEKLNHWFNNYYIKYLNHKFAYSLDKESEFVPITKETDLSLIFCLKEERTILNGNMVSYNNMYYKIKDKELLYVGTSVTVMHDIFDIKKIRIKYNKKIYETELIDGHRQDPIKRQLKINNQKELNEVLDNMNLTQQEKIKRAQEIINNIRSM